MGIEFFDGDIDSLINYISNKEYRNKKVIHFVAASTIVSAFENFTLRDQLTRNICIVDSKPLYWFLKFKFGKLQHIRGTDFMRKVLFDSDIKCKNFLFGSTHENLKRITEKISQVKSDKLETSYYAPEILTDWHNCLDDWVSIFRNSHSDLIWIGMGSPKQDLLARDLSTRVEQTIITVGAAFDFIAESKLEAPRCLQSLGLEWLFRFFSEPKRLFYRYTVGNIKFLKLVIREFMKLKTNE